jgi:transcriptional regulator with XRE-family HTH domain
VPRREVSRPDNWPEITAALGHEIRRRRLELGLTQEGLAERSGISRNQIQNLENARNNSGGVGNPGLDVIWALAGAFDIEVVDLIQSIQR